MSNSLSGVVFNDANNYGAPSADAGGVAGVAQVIPPDPVIPGDSITAPLAPRPGHSFYISNLNTAGFTISHWANASAITPYVDNDLVLNQMPSATNYVSAFEGAGGSLGLLTNGLTQSQIGPAPGLSQPAIGDGQLADASNNSNVVSETASSYYFTKHLRRSKRFGQSRRFPDAEPSE